MMTWDENRAEPTYSLDAGSLIRGEVERDENRGGWYWWVAIREWTNSDVRGPDDVGIHIPGGGERYLRYVATGKGTADSADEAKHAAEQWLTERGVDVSGESEAKPTTSDLTLYTVRWHDAGGWLVAAESAVQACELVAVDALIPYDELHSAEYVVDDGELDYTMRGFPHVMHGGLWRKEADHA